MVKPLYFIVHPDMMNPSHFTYEEVERIRREEEHIISFDDPHRVPPNLPRDRDIRVCGAFARMCVQIQYESLLKKQYRAEIYEKATQDWEDR